MINKIYLDPTVQSQIRKVFQKSKVARIDNFLNNKEYNKIKKLANKLKFSHTKIPDKYSFSVANSKEMQTLFAKEITPFIQNIAKAKPGHIEIKKSLSRRSGLLDAQDRLSNLDIKKFSHRDYTLLHDEEKSKVPKRVEFFFFISPDWNPLHGGNKVYVKKGRSLIFPPKANSLVIVEIDSKTNSFLQYINHKVKKKSFIIIEGNSILTNPKILTSL